MDKITYVMTLDDMITIYTAIGIMAGLIIYGLFYGIFKLLGIIRTKRDKKRNKNIDLGEG